MKLREAAEICVMSSSIICTHSPNQYGASGDQIKKDEMGEACSVYEGGEK
jgi:hypothetical protein